MAYHFRLLWERARRAVLGSGTAALVPACADAVFDAGLGSYDTRFWPRCVLRYLVLAL